jgi:hypothetical protein
VETETASQGARYRSQQYKKMLKMEDEPQSLLKTKGQKNLTSGVNENKQVRLF